MRATRLYLIRHGQVVNHHEYRYNGHFDIDITPTGVEQMRRVSESLSREPIKAVFSSDLQRAVKGARIIGKALGIEPVMVHDLRELNLGRWEGLTREEAVARYPEEADFSFKDLATSKVKEGESLVELRARVVPALSVLLDRHRHESVCVVAHGGVNRVVLSEAMGLPLERFFSIEQDYGCLNIIDYLDDGLKVVKLLNGGPNQDMRPTEIY
ncbi:MAG: histidine phosphatase family protein [Deltaproteobacteria bacterium]|nr:histidine phosphatase family protein [Deltaproteobacteria bacterium]MCL4874465.1 histidine phosphatase family protein [bacterium]